ncbi:NAD/NADP octopine/nopaline dehydrogenase family protein [Humitalea sp. 24SJ18S-53]|uniref:NAD/NADP octopine/nopaline dehydrogenase family protein n=1 Tax=Humitalea sp. 24SJ18S-53 TaxID=3422307 RepID=UPI003D67822F
MRLAVLGAGAIGPAAAVLAVSRGHEAALWSPSGAGTAGCDGRMTAEGALEGVFALRIATDLADALAGADAALLVVPAYAYPALLPAIARELRVPLLIAPCASLAPLALDAAMAGAAHRPAIGAMATTPVMGRRLAPDRVRVAGIRKAVDLAAVPTAAAPDLAALATALFGHASPIVPNALQAALGNANPIIHAVMALTNVTRMENAEPWPQYAMMTPAACRLMVAMAEERDRLAQAFGLTVLSLEESLHRSNGVALGPMHEMAAVIAQSRGSVLGPATMDTRYVTEDVPYGLAFYLWLGATRGLRLPVTDAVVTALEVLWGQPLRDNPLLSGLDPAGLDAALQHGIGRQPSV